MLYSELRKRVGILSRMTWQLQQDLAVRMIKLIFTAKLRYTKEVLCDSTNPE
jgi:hypothetical protein